MLRPGFVIQPTSKLDRVKVAYLDEDVMLDMLNASTTRRVLSLPVLEPELPAGVEVLRIWYAPERRAFAALLCHREWPPILPGAEPQVIGAFTVEHLTAVPLRPYTPQSQTVHVMRAGDDEMRRRYDELTATKAQNRMLELGMQIVQYPPVELLTEEQQDEPAVHDAGECRPLPLERDAWAAQFEQFREAHPELTTLGAVALFHDIAGMQSSPRPIPRDIRPGDPVFLPPAVPPGAIPAQRPAAKLPAELQPPTPPAEESRAPGKVNFREFL